MTQELMVVTLNAKQVAHACEQLVAARMNDSARGYAYKARMSGDQVIVTVSKKRTHKLRDKAKEAHGAETRG